MKYAFLSLILLLTALSCRQASEKQATAEQQKVTNTVSADDFEKAMADTAHTVVLDVRTKEEYAESHLRRAIFIDVSEKNFREECLRRLPKGKVVCVYCRTAFRSKTAAGILNEAGYDVVHLRGGFVAWTEAGKEIVK
jgi:rhodanese-related sulfurtransferase